jgi:hypothetical protein
MKKVLINWKREYSNQDELMFNYYHLLIVGFNHFTVSDNELKVLVELNKKDYPSNQIPELAGLVGFKPQVLKNTLTKFKKLKLVYNIDAKYSINPVLKLDPATKSMDIKCVLKDGTGL